LPKIKLSLLFLFYLCHNLLFGQQFVFNANCQKAYQLCASFKFDEANKILDLEKKNNPSNLIPLLINDIEDASRVFITEEKLIFDKLKVNKKLREAQFEKGNKDSPWYLYSLAETNLHWAAARLKFEEYVTASLEVNRAYSMLKQNEKLFPDFAPTHKSLGLMRAIIGTLPDQYQWLLKFIGVTGNFNGGVSEMKNFIISTEKDSTLSCFSTEILLFSSIMEANFSNTDNSATSLLNKLDKIEKLSPLLAYSYLSIAAKTGQSKRIFTKNNIADFGPAYFQFQYLNLLYGEAKLCKGDADADVYIKKFITNFKGKNYIKNAYMRLWWHSIINNKKDLEVKYFEAIKTKGNDIVDEDKYALNTYEKKLFPNAELLKARLFFDGGYYTQALKTLVDLDIEKLNESNYKVEYFYRLGRIYQKTNITNSAIKSFENTIKFGASLPEYYAASACYELGKIYETKEDFETALSYFEKSKTFKNHSYRTSLNQKAKAAISRVEAKMKVAKK